MHVLIVSATPLEIAPIVAQLGRPLARSPRVTAYRRSGHDVDVLLTGVGMVATASWCSRTLARTPYDLALNFGVCGSFDRALEPGRVVHVVADRIAELGAEDGDAFLTIEQLNLVGEDAFTGGQLVNVAPPDNAALSRLLAVGGITVNTVHGNERSIAAVVRRFAPQVESMEGAAFMHACLIHTLAFAQVRAVSNVVEKRNRDAWRMADAIGSLAITALNIIDGL
jgi:futalosine hydrolase